MYRVNNSITAIILAAGSGSRMKLDVTKQRLLIRGKSVLSRTVEVFNKSDVISSIIVVAREDEVDYVQKEVASFSKVSKLVVGGATRAESARNGFIAINDSTEFVAIHDGARCFITTEMIAKVAQDAARYGAATASSVLTDSLKDIDQNGFIITNRDRASVRIMQTPQVFKKELYKKALSAADLSDPKITDDNMLLELIGIPVYCTDTGKQNIKITVREDLEYADFLADRGVDNE